MEDPDSEVTEAVMAALLDRLWRTARCGIQSGAFDCEAPSYALAAVTPIIREIATLSNACRPSHGLASLARPQCHAARHMALRL